MRNPKLLLVTGCLLGLAVGSLGLLSGCGDDSKTTGTQVPVDIKQEQAKQKDMSKFYK